MLSLLIPKWPTEMEAPANLINRTNRDSSTGIFASGCSQISGVQSGWAPATQLVTTGHLNTKSIQLGVL